MDLRFDGQPFTADPLSPDQAQQEMQRVAAEQAAASREMLIRLGRWYPVSDKD